MKVILVDDSDMYTENYALAFTPYLVNDDEAETEARAVLLGLVADNVDLLPELGVTFEEIEDMSPHGLRDFVQRRNFLSTKVHILDVELGKPSDSLARSIRL